MISIYWPAPLVTVLGGTVFVFFQNFVDWKLWVLILNYSQLISKLLLSLFSADLLVHCTRIPVFLSLQTDCPGPWLLRKFRIFIYIYFFFSEDWQDPQVLHCGRAPKAVNSNDFFFSWLSIIKVLFLITCYREHLSMWEKYF